MLLGLKCKLPRRFRKPHATGRHGPACAAPHPDPRIHPHVATLIALGRLGWHVTEIRPDRDDPVVWRVTVTRYDKDMSMTLLEADPDVALEELARYAAADAEEPPPR